MQSKNHLEKHDWWGEITLLYFHVCFRVSLCYGNTVRLHWRKNWPKSTTSPCESVRYYVKLGTSSHKILQEKSDNESKSMCGTYRCKLICWKILLWLIVWFAWVLKRYELFFLSRYLWNTTCYKEYFPRWHSKRECQHWTCRLEDMVWCIVCNYYQ